MPRYVNIEPYEDCRITLHKEDEGFPVSELETADVQEVKHGKWIYKYKDTDHDDVAYCSLCNFYVEDKINNVGLCYKCCPNCFAKMDGDE